MPAQEDVSGRGDGGGFDGWLSRSAKKTQRLADRLEARRRALQDRELDGCTFQPEMIARRGGTQLRVDADRQQARMTTTKMKLKKKKKKKKKKIQMPMSYYVRARTGGGGSDATPSRDGRGYQEMFEATRQEQVNQASAPIHPTPAPSPLLSPSSSPSPLSPPPPFPASLPPTTATTSLAAIVADGEGSSQSSARKSRQTLVTLGSLFQCAWEGILSHRTGIPRPVPRLLDLATDDPLRKELSFLQGKISATLVDHGGEGDGGGVYQLSGPDQTLGIGIRGQSLGRSRLAKYLSAERAPSSIDWEDVRAIQAERERATAEAQRERIASVRKERERVYHRLLNFYRHRMKAEGFHVGERGESGEEGADTLKTFD